MENHYRVIIKGGYGLYNFGDDALMVAAYSVVRNVFAASDIALLCWDAPYIKKFIPEAQIISINNLNSNKVQTDFLLYGGGTQFYSFPLSRIKIRKIPKVGNIIPYFFRPTELFKKGIRRIIRKKALINRDLIAHNRSAALGIGLGPFVSSSIEEARSRRLLKKMDFISVRDPVSAKICESWELKNIIIGADLCYLPKLWDIENLKTKTQDRTIKLKEIGVVVRDWKHSDEGAAYNEKLFQLVNKLRRNKLNVKFILLRKNDANWINQLNEKGESPIIWDPDTNNIDRFLEILSGFDAFITARYHGAVFASLLCKPSLCIGIEPKLEIIAEQLKNFAAVWKYPYDTEVGLRTIRDLENNPKYLAAVIKSETQRAVKMAEDCRQYLSGE